MCNLYSLIIKFLITSFSILIYFSAIAHAGVITQTASRSSEFFFIQDIDTTRGSFTSGPSDDFSVTFDLHDRSAGILNEVIFEQTLTGVFSGSLNNRYQAGSGPAEVDFDFAARITGVGVEDPPAILPNGASASGSTPITTNRVSAPADGEANTPISFPDFMFSHTLTQSFIGADTAAFVGILQPIFSYEFLIFNEAGAVEIPPIAEFCYDGVPRDGACIPTLSSRQNITNDIRLTYRFTDTVPVDEPTTMWIMLLGLSVIVLGMKKPIKKV